MRFALIKLHTYLYLLNEDTDKKDTNTKFDVISIFFFFNEIETIYVYIRNVINHGGMSSSRINENSVILQSILARISDALKMNSASRWISFVTA